jgi:hypothetical protein
VLAAFPPLAQARGALALDQVHQDLIVRAQRAPG